MTRSRDHAHAPLRSKRVTERAHAAPLQRQRLLDSDEVRRLDRVYLGAYMQPLAHRRREPLAVHLHLPKLPELLSLSIAALTAPVLLGTKVWPAVFPDDLRDSTDQPVAVKGTGPSAWITITVTDRHSHALMWVDYADRSGAVPRSLCEPLLIRAGWWQLPDGSLLLSCCHRTARLLSRPDSILRKWSRRQRGLGRAKQFLQYRAGITVADGKMQKQRPGPALRRAQRDQIVVTVKPRLEIAEDSSVVVLS
jgi:hypothetical protein